MKNAKTASASSSTWNAWVISSTSTRLVALESHDVRVVPELVAPDLVVEPVDLLDQPDDEEPHRHRREQQHRAPQHAAVEGRGDHPDLGVDEQERHEQQQHRQRPGRQREQQLEAARVCRSAQTAISRTCSARPA